MIPFLGFLPDLEPTTSGALKDVSGVIPTKKGFQPIGSSVTAGLTAVSSTVNSLAVVQNLGGTRYAYAGTDTTLEEASTSSWTDRTRAVGGAYSCGAEARWSFAQFGNLTLAANVADAMQVATSGSSKFADISGAPQAAHIAVSGGFVMAANLSTNSDEWHCSAYNDYTDWTEAVSTQCTSGRLVGGGEITGIKKIGTGFVAFKSNSLYQATYVGAPVVWQWDEIPGDVGCPHGHASVDIGDRIAFLGPDSFYVYDGARAANIGEGVREWFFATADNSVLHRTIATYNPTTGNVIWYFVSNAASGTTPDAGLVYNVWTGKWGKFAKDVRAASKYYPAGVIIDGATTDLSDLYSTIDDANDISFDSPYWSAGVASAGVVGTDDILYTLTGPPGASSILLNTIGDDEAFTTIQRIRPRFLLAPSSSSVEYRKDDIYGDSFAVKGTYELKNGRYDFQHSARWHEVQFSMSGDYEITGASVYLVQDGTQ